MNQRNKIFTQENYFNFRNFLFSILWHIIFVIIRYVDYKGGRYSNSNFMNQTVKIKEKLQFTEWLISTKFERHNSISVRKKNLSRINQATTKWSYKVRFVHQSRFSLCCCIVWRTFRYKYLSFAIKALFTTILFSIQNE